MCAPPDHHDHSYYAMAQHNWAPATHRDELVYGSSRPGYHKDNEVPRGVRDQDVAAWCEFMTAKGVKRVLSLLGDDEVEWYQTPIADQLKAGGLDGDACYTRTSVFQPGALDIIRTALRDAEKNNEKIVVHCSGGGGRASLGLGVWLCDKYGLTPEEAAQEISNSADEFGVNRRADAAKLAKLLQNGTLGK